MPPPASSSTIAPNPVKRSSTRSSKRRTMVQVVTESQRKQSASRQSKRKLSEHPSPTHSALSLEDIPTVAEASSSGRHLGIPPQVLSAGPTENELRLEVVIIPFNVSVNRFSATSSLIDFLVWCYSSRTFQASKGFPSQDPSPQ